MRTITIHVHGTYETEIEDDVEDVADFAEELFGDIELCDVSFELESYDVIGERDVID